MEGEIYSGDHALLLYCKPNMQHFCAVGKYSGKYD